ncbi:MAG: VanZ family protein [Candidatus Faecousia sp.]|nr:VanZ family protein [Candidatus Faecousia sp.]
MENFLLELLDKLCGAVVSLPLVLLSIFVFDRERAKRRWGWMVLLTLYLNAMYIVIGVPGVQYICWDPTLNLIPFQDFSARNIEGMILNAIMFAPLGFLLPAYFERYRHWGRTLAAGFLTSLTAELIQLFTLRATDVDDLIMNTLGTVIGFLLAKLVFRRRTAVYRGKKDWLELVIVNGIVLLVIVFIRYPLMEVMLKLLKI